MSDIIDKAQQTAEFYRNLALAKKRKKVTAISLQYCEDCGDEIPKARREQVQGVRYCFECQVFYDNHNKAVV